MNRIRRSASGIAEVMGYMAKIVWLNGAYGAGKTTCAFELHRRLPGSFVYDAENIGYWIRKNSPKSLHCEDFQNHPQWRMFNREMLMWLANGFNGTVIVPMTLVNSRYYDEIVRNLSDNGVSVYHFILDASRETLLKRLNKRLDRGNTWAKAQIDRCLAAFKQEITEMKISTDNRAIDEIIADIAANCGLELAQDKRGRFRKFTDRYITLAKHIRR
jgi:chloramphenicol 3-O-phosphotransferase